MDRRTIRRQSERALLDTLRHIDLLKTNTSEEPISNLPVNDTNEQYDNTYNGASSCPNSVQNYTRRTCIPSPGYQNFSPTTNNCGAVSAEQNLDVFSTVGMDSTDDNNFDDMMVFHNDVGNDPDISEYAACLSAADTDSDEPTQSPDNSTSGSDQDERDNHDDDTSSSDNNDGDSNSDDGCGYPAPNLDPEHLKRMLTEWAVITKVPLIHINMLLAILKPHFPNLPNDARTLLRTPTSYQITPMSNGHYYHFGLRDGVKTRLRINEKIQDYEQLSIQINIDGLPLYKSTSDQFWPILAKIQEDEQNQPFLVGLWIGRSKPSDCNEYLDSFVQEFRAILADGLQYKEKLYNIAICNFVCDTPAKAFVKKIKSHNAYHGCQQCTTEGVYNLNRMTFPDVDADLRTDEDFILMVDQEHHHDMDNPSILTQLPIGMIQQFPLDYMHLVCLGVMKRILTLLLSGPLVNRIGGYDKQMISERLAAISASMPREFMRKGRPLDQIDRWKATEYRTFLLYSGAVVLRGHLKDVLYANFLLLHVAITVLCSPKYSQTHCDYAERLLLTFVSDFGNRYGKHFVVYNVHNLIHLVNDVRRFGPLDRFSAFPFENHLQSLKRLVRKPKFPLVQVIRRLHEQDIVHVPFTRLKTYCKMPHREGPLHAEVDANCQQFRQVHTREFMLATYPPDNAIQVDRDFYVVRNIIKVHGQIMLVCQRFQRKQDFFSYPVHSMDLDIAYATDLDDILTSFSLREVDSKLVMMPMDNGYVCYPLIHCVN